MNPICTEEIPSFSTDLTYVIEHGPASIIVTGKSDPNSSKILVIPILRPIRKSIDIVMS